MPARLLGKYDISFPNKTYGAETDEVDDRMLQQLAALPRRLLI